MENKENDKVSQENPIQSSIRQEKMLYGDLLEPSVSLDKWYPEDIESIKLYYIVCNYINRNKPSLEQLRKIAEILEL